ncbi:FtsX-like permease family protein [Nonomuraea soli]|uniref:Putative ABC transport system permease protein n=1 Tax=Nonomuraea soli TaxID=1032476 RepID=A0A7W0CM30_9ACTN|nr:FtsX-like permease family protein [Nonomuraea soli]MBA2893691.1 putative ABC transport system permease protein [Nonomuraea soli]
MGRMVLVARLAVRDLRRRRVETALLLLAVLAATTTLTLGLVLREAAAGPYQSTREATAGPDVVASAQLATLEKLATASGVAAYSGPYPVVPSELRAAGRTSDVQVVGRDTASAAVDRPAVVEGGWAGDGGAVLEAAFARALGVGVGDQVTLGGRAFVVSGLAVTAATAPYPGGSCYVTAGCASGEVPEGTNLPAGLLRDPGLVWLTQADTRALSDDVSYVLNLRLSDPAQARSFADAHPSVITHTWQTVQEEATELARDSQILLLIGAWLLGLLAVAGLAVLVGGRIADQTRRVGLLKAVGGTPGLVAAVMLAEYVLVALAAAVGGLALGTLAAPLLTGPGAGLLGQASTPVPTVATAAWVVAAALGVAVVATGIPSLRAARSSTVGALADAPRPPRRVGWLIAISARLPASLLLAVRVAARRPRRVVLGAVSVAVTVSGLFVLLVLDAFLASRSGTPAYGQAQVEVLREVLLVWTVVLLCLAAVNTLVITWATVLDNRRSSALARALGATPRDVSTAVAAAQVLPALVGAALGVFPGGFALFGVINLITGGDGARVTMPSAPELFALVAAAVLAVALLTGAPALLGSRRPVAESLRG